jgi:hypothetical protein
LADLAADAQAWLAEVNDILGVNWNNAPETRNIINEFISEGADPKTIGLILIEDLIELLDDYDGPVIFMDLWEQFMYNWDGWQNQSPLAFTGANNSSYTLPDTSGMSDVYAGYIEDVYATLGVSWSAVPESRDTLVLLITAGLSHRDIALIMIEDFLEYLDDYDGDVAFEDLWDRIIRHNWRINHQLRY